MSRFAGIPNAKNDDVVQWSFRSGSKPLRYPYGFAVTERDDGLTVACSLSDGTEGIAWCEGTLDSPAARAMAVAWTLGR
ncbi:MAG TPA: hypothetical protein VGY48_15415 [Vicinamibacterales bacterium]|jgi:hypothetical protein|nr:hypothetical protein [Vicinamibacterales bacterium]